MAMGNGQGNSLHLHREANCLSTIHKRVPTYTYFEQDFFFDKAAESPLREQWKGRLQPFGDSACTLSTTDLSGLSPPATHKNMSHPTAGDRCWKPAWNTHTSHPKAEAFTEKPTITKSYLCDRSTQCLGPSIEAVAELFWNDTAQGTKMSAANEREWWDIECHMSH